MNDVDREATLRDVRPAYTSASPRIRNSGAVAFADVAKDAQLEHLVGLTQWLASPSHPSLMPAKAWRVDRLFSMRLEAVRNGAHGPDRETTLIQSFPDSRHVNEGLWLQRLILKQVEFSVTIQHESLPSRSR